MTNQPKAQVRFDANMKEAFALVEQLQKAMMVVGNNHNANWCDVTAAHDLVVALKRASHQMGLGNGEYADF